MSSAIKKKKHAKEIIANFEMAEEESDDEEATSQPTKPVRINSTPPRKSYNQELSYVPSVLVLGSGVMGLTSALILQEAGFVVDIWAKDLPPHTHSNQAGAYWYPFSVQPMHRVKKWTMLSLKYTMDNLISDPRSGIMPYRYLQLQTEAQDPAFLGDKGSLVNYRRAKPEELPKGYSHGFLVDTFVMNPDIMMGYLARKFQGQGGRIQQKWVRDINEAFIWYDVVINCTGLGSRELFNDHTVFAARGQTVVIRQTETLPMVVNDESGPNKLGYIIPRQMDIVLGGTFQPGNESLLVDPKDTQEILRRCEGISHGVSSKDWEILQEKVGLRPCRPEVRLEPEFFQQSRKLVVHNYGHGGAGWTLSWGCALEVCDIVKQNLTKLKPHSSL